MLELQEGKKGWTKKSINTVVLLTGVAAIALAYFTGGLSIIIGGSIIGSTAVGVGGNELLHYKVLEKHKDKIKDCKSRSLFPDHKTFPSRTQMYTQNVQDLHYASLKHN